MIDILLVEDDKEICFILTELLKRNHYNVSAYHNGIEAIEALSSKKYDLMLLDLMLPDLPGEKILFHLKKHNNSIPVIVISAKNQPEIRINLLRSGADDYITKPFIVDELVARVKAHLRREKRRNSIGNNIIKIGEIEIHKDSYEVYLNKELIDLSTREFQLFLYLCENAGQVLSREQIFNSVWGSDFGDIGTVAVNIKSLRDKIDKENKYIKTIWGVGYKLIKPIGEVI